MEVIEKMWRLHENVGLAFNGGKDSCVVLELMSRVDANRLSDTLVVFFQQEDEFEEVLEFVQGAKRRYKLRKFVVMTGDMRKNLFFLLRVHPHITAFVNGTRAGDPNAQKRHFEEATAGWPSCIRVAPILDWSYQRVWQFLRDANDPIPVPVLYKRGYTSLGNKRNTIANPALLNDNGTYEPAWMLKDASLERASRTAI